MDVANKFLPKKNGDILQKLIPKILKENKFVNI